MKLAFHNSFTNIVLIIINIIKPTYLLDILTNLTFIVAQGTFTFSGVFVGSFSTYHLILNTEILCEKFKRVSLTYSTISTVKFIQLGNSQIWIHDTLKFTMEFTFFTVTFQFLRCTIFPLYMLLPFTFHNGIRATYVLNYNVK